MGFDPPAETEDLSWAASLRGEGLVDCTFAICVDSVQYKAVWPHSCFDFGI